MGTHSTTTVHRNTELILTIPTAHLNCTPVSFFFDLAFFLFFNHHLTHRLPLSLSFVSICKLCKLPPPFFFPSICPFLFYRSKQNDVRVQLYEKQPSSFSPFLFISIHFLFNFVSPSHSFTLPVSQYSYLSLQFCPSLSPFHCLVTFISRSISAHPTGYISRPVLISPQL